MHKTGEKLSVQYLTPNQKIAINHKHNVVIGGIIVIRSGLAVFIIN